jgi:hypothetical protein
MAATLKQTKESLLELMTAMQQDATASAWPADEAEVWAASTASSTWTAGPKACS